MVSLQSYRMSCSSVQSTPFPVGETAFGKFCVCRPIVPAVSNPKCEFCFVLNEQAHEQIKGT